MWQATMVWWALLYGIICFSVVITNLVGRSHKELDLTDQVAVKQFFDEENPDAIVLAAASVGGIMAILTSKKIIAYNDI